MTPERRRLVTDLLHAALARAPEDRAAFLDTACRDDAELRREVEALLGPSGSGAATLVVPPPADAPVDPDGTELRAGAGVRRVGPYAIDRILGHGGMGVVFLAEDTRLGRKVALKALPPPFALDERRRERLRLEARAAAALSHPGIATVYALEELGSDVYVAFEYVRGETLRAELERGPLPLPRLVATCIELARALTAAHAAGIVHRDLKPENVMRCADGSVKILDFGLARVQSPDADTKLTRLTASGMVVGTPAYMSPEQLEAGPVDARTDIFALGVMMYEMACGAHPFQGRTPASTIARIMDSEPPPLADRMPAPLAALADIVSRCLRKDPEARYRSADELAADLAGLRQGSTASPEPGRYRRPASAGAAAWWRIHQIAVMSLYAVMGVPMWMVKAWMPGPWGILLFVFYVACAALNGTLRAHLLFTERHNSAALAGELTRSEPIRLWSDRGVALALVAAAVPASTAHLTLAAILVAVAVGSTVASHIIEPSTTRAAFSR